MTASSTPSSPSRACAPLSRCLLGDSLPSSIAPWTRGTSLGSFLQRLARRRRTTGFFALAAIFAVSLLRSPQLPRPSTAALVGAAGSLGGGMELADPEAFANAVYHALDAVQPLAAKVNSGNLIRNFGEKAHAIIRNAVRKSPNSPGEVEGALDGVLHALFLQQLTLLHQRVVDSFEGDRRLASVMRRADAQFVRSAQALVRPFSTWSFEAERAALRDSLDGLLQREVKLQQERSRAAHTQRATADIIGKLTKEMEMMTESLRGSAAGGPMQVWTSYRVKGTPLQVSGRYQEGRANIELSLAADTDPATAEAGFVQGITSKNLGLSLNIGM